MDRQGNSQEANNRNFDSAFKKRWISGCIKIIKRDQGVSLDRRNKLFDYLFEKRWYDKAKIVVSIGVSLDRSKKLVQ